MPKHWHPALLADDLWDGEMVAVTVADHRVLIVNVDGTYRAYSNRCPHQASPLDEGTLDGLTLTCGTHLWQFNVLTGNGINPANATLTAYGCEPRDDGSIYVGLEG